MKLKNVLPHIHAGNTSCRICDGVGIVLTENAANSPYPVLSLCHCAKENCFTCPSKGRAPYMFYSEESNKMLPCLCHEARIKMGYLEKKVALSEIPERYKFKFLENVDFRESEKGTMSVYAAHDWAADMVENYKTNHNLQGMYLYGNAGSGKTLFACTILNELIFRYNADCRYVKINSFFSDLRETYQRDSNTYGQETDVIKEYSEVDVLVIDDFGVQKDSDWVQSKLYDLIDKRYEKKNLTLLTSNHNLKDWESKWEGRIYSRLCEMTKEIHLDCPDYRQKFRR